LSVSYILSRFVFRHPEPVSAVSFSLDRDYLFATGCSDHIARVWSVSDGNVLSSSDNTENDITALSFFQDTVITGHADGEVRFYRYKHSKLPHKKGTLNKLDYFTTIDCRNRHGRKSKGTRVTGLQAFSSRFNNENSKEKEYILVTTNDSRIRLCALDSFVCLYKFKGNVNHQFPIAASINEYAKYIISGSEDNNVYIWPFEIFEQDASSVNNAVTNRLRLSGGVRKSSAYQKFQGHSSIVTCAIFAPARTSSICRNFDVDMNTKYRDSPLKGGIIVTAGFDGHIHVFEMG